MKRLPFLNYAKAVPRNQTGSRNISEPLIYWGLRRFIESAFRMTVL
jgi:hypothetical protein